MKKVYWLLLSLIWSNLAWSSFEWEKFYSEEGIELYRASKLESGIIPFKATATIDASLNKILMHLLDPKGRPSWAPKLDFIEIHEQISSHEFIFSEYYKTPWPAIDRQFLLRGKVDYKSKGHVLLTGRNALEERFISKDHILCDVKFLDFELKALNQSRTNLSFTFLGDMNGWMPIWLINLIQRKWPLRFIKGLKSVLVSKEPEDLRIFRGLKFIK